MASSIEPSFVDREKEISSLRNMASRTGSTPVYIYGPEGCGKTRLLRELISRFTSYFGDDAVAIYIDALERDSIDAALYTSRGLALAREVLVSLAERYAGRVGEALANSIMTLLEKALVNRRIRDNYILIAVDDVTGAIGVDRVEWYLKWLYEAMKKLGSHGPRAINIVVATSEGPSLDSVVRHTYTHALLMWNLDRRSFEELFHLLDPPGSVVYEEVWSILGGNPRQLVELAYRYGWALDMLRKALRARIKRIVEEIARQGLGDMLDLAASDVSFLDRVRDEPERMEKIGRLVKILVEKNLIIYKDWITLSGEQILEDRSLGIGKRYAWQLPIYPRLIIEALTEL